MKKLLLVMVVLLTGCTADDDEWVGVEEEEEEEEDTETATSAVDYWCVQDPCLTDEDCGIHPEYGACVASYCLPDRDDIDFSYLNWDERPDEYNVEPGTCVVVDCVPGEQYTCPSAAGHWNKELICNPTPQDIIEVGVDAGLEIPSHICGY